MGSHISKPRLCSKLMKPYYLPTAHSKNAPKKCFEDSERFRDLARNKNARWGCSVFFLDALMFLPSGKLTWQWKIPIFKGNTSSKGPFFISMLVYQRVFFLNSLGILEGIIPLLNHQFRFVFKSVDYLLVRSTFTLLLIFSSSLEDRENGHPGSFAKHHDK